MNKKLMYAAIALIAVSWTGYRAVVLSGESRRVVYNPARDFMANGRPADTLEITKKTMVLREPISVKNNRAYISFERIGKFRTGQKIASGKIISVSNRIDLDTGMYLVRTTGVSNGEHFAEESITGFFIPVYAMAGNSVMVVENGVATSREIKIKNRDSENIAVSDGLNTGDIVILSQIQNGEKIK